MSIQFRHLYGQKPVHGFDPELFDSDDIGFVVFRYHTCADEIQDSEAFGNSLRSKSATSGLTFKETILIVSKKLRTAVNGIATYCADMTHVGIGEMNTIPRFYSNEMYAPYLFLYHHRDKLKKLIEESNDELLKKQIKALLNYLDEEYGEIYSDCDKLLAQGKTKREYIEMVFRPNEIIIADRNSMPHAYVLRGWPVGGPRVTLSSWSWKIDGNRIVRSVEGLDLTRPTEEVFPINKLKVHPIRFASKEKTEQLRVRGEKCWRLRHPKYVAYAGLTFSGDEYFNPETRFMIDYGVYKRLHENNKVPPAPTIAILYDPWPMEVSLNDELEKDQFMLLPPNIHAFYLKEKEWKDLLVDNIRPITWNKDAFDRLVLPTKTKDLVKALVMVRTGKQNSQQGMHLAKRRDDMITGKGNGLIVLLHGGPGTGKTLTAESVAELAELPLYSVTCGDIGTNAEAVEKYLQTILYLGKTWNCGRLQYSCL
jgi:hypothetical protein